MTNFIVTVNETAQQLVENGTGIVVQGVTLQAPKLDSIIAQGQAKIDISGTVNAGQESVRLPTYAIRLNDAELNVNIAESGVVSNSGNSFGGAIYGTIAADSTINNAGLIEGGRQGINIKDNSGDSTLNLNNSGNIGLSYSPIIFSSSNGQLNIQNSGTITKASGVSHIALRVHIDGENNETPSVSIDNSGEMGGLFYSRNNSSAATMDVFNSGVITGNISSGSPLSPAPEAPVKFGDRVINDGLIEGAVNFGGLADFYDGHNGTVTVTISGGRGNDTLIGGDSNDFLQGGGDEDYLVGGKGDDLIYGDGGQDTVGYDGVASDYTFVRVDEDKVTVTSDLYGIDKLRNIEQAYFTGDDQVFTIDQLVENNLGDGEQEGNLVHDIPGETQYLFGNGGEIFVVDGNASDYNWGPTEDGLGTVIWNASGYDILYDFAAVQFSDAAASLTDDGYVNFVDVPGQTQYLFGTVKDDAFIVNGNASDYNWGATQDGAGVVIWNDTGHDILYDLEVIQFNDSTAPLNSLEYTQYNDVAAETQYLTGTDHFDEFIIDGYSEHYGWGETADGTGTVIWSKLTGAHDILYDIEQIGFNDITVDTGQGNELG